MRELGHLASGGTWGAGVGNYKYTLRAASAKPIQVTLFRRECQIFAKIVNVVLVPGCELIDGRDPGATVHRPRDSFDADMSGPVPTETEAPVVGVEDLVRYFHGGDKPPLAWRTGIEQEKVVVFADGGSVAFDGTAGIEELLRRLETRGYTGIREDGRLIALRRNKENITVEPGGQVELSGPTLRTATACRDELALHVAELADVGGTLGMRFLGVGLSPFATLDDLEWLPKRRYAVMRDYLPRRGRLGRHMMKLTATVQANFDFDDEPTAAEKVRTASGVTSIVTALFAASPISEGRPNGYRSFRAAIWLETDEDRCGLLPAAFEDGFGFRHYVEWALDVPMFFVVRSGVYHPIGARMTFRQFMSEGWNGHKATMSDWEIHLSTLFPEVRLKRYIEVRGADAGPLPMAFGLAALWRGLLDDRDACRAAWKLVQSATMDERQALRRTVPKAGMSARFVGRSLQELAVELCRIAAAGLSRLPGGGGDAALMEPLEERAVAGRSPADDMLADFEACGGDPRKLVARWELRV
jgi:glutamate--cysteine ligase